VCVWLEGDFTYIVEEFQVPLWLVAGCGFHRGSALVTMTQFAAAALTFSPGLWWCSIFLGALFVWWWCSLLCIMYECFFFLHEVTVLLPFI
jgi:hypothetical protein